MNLLLVKFTNIQLLFTYIHIGFSKSQGSNHLMTKYLLGLHWSVQVINLNFTLFFLKLFFFLLSGVVINKNAKVLFFSEYLKLFNKKVKYIYRYLGILYYFRTWANGGLTKLKFYNLYHVDNEFKDLIFLKKEDKSIFLNVLPNFVTAVSYFNLYTPTNLVKEAKKLAIPIFSFIDSNFNPLLFSYFSISNMKSFKSIKYVVSLFDNFILKIFMLKRKVFLKKILSFTLIK